MVHLCSHVIWNLWDGKFMLAEKFLFCFARTKKKIFCYFVKIKWYFYFNLYTLLIHIHIEYVLFALRKYRLS